MRIIYLTNSLYTLNLIEYLCGWEERTLERHVAGSNVSVQIDFVDARTRVWVLDIEEALAPPNSESVREDWEAIQHADGAVYVASVESHAYAQPKRHLEILRLDLIAAGRDPAAFPVAFELLRRPGGDFASDDEVNAVLRWPRCERFVITGEVPLAERGHERALDWVLEQASQK